MNAPAEKDAELLFAEMRGELPPGEAAQASFQPLPSGVYQGRVYIVVKTVNNQDSPNYGRKKYEIQLTVTEGDQKGGGLTTTALFYLAIWAINRLRAM